MQYKPMTTTKIENYYEVGKDIEAHPECWCFIVVGGRNTGKTYGGLSYFLDKEQKLVFVKRTNDDVDTICAGNSIGKKAPEFEVDFSPYKPINRDRGTTIKAYKIKNGLGAFYRSTDTGEAAGAPVCYLTSLYAVSKIKGFDMSDAKAIIFDEFIPQPWERVNKKEGEQLLDLYKTVDRDRVERGQEELKLICFANAVNIYNPTCEILELTDTIMDMLAKGQQERVLYERGIFIRLLTSEVRDTDKRTGVYRATEGTAWNRMAFENEFSYNDFSCVKRVSLKGMIPDCAYIYKGKKHYIYVGDNGWYVTDSAHQNANIYNLDTETGQRLFYAERVIDIVNDTIEGRGYYAEYTMYDLFMNYKKRFTV